MAKKAMATVLFQNGGRHLKHIIMALFRSIFTFFCVVLGSLSHHMRGVAADSLQARLETVLTPIVNEVS